MEYWKNDTSVIILIKRKIMKTKNILSAYQGEKAIDGLENVPTDFKTLKKHEIRNINSFADIMKQNGCLIKDFDGFYIGYIINQVNKEFDLLKFGEKSILNIEIKSELKVANKSKKLLDQMRKNYYYLKFLGKDINIYEYVENDGFYFYDNVNDDIIGIKPYLLAEKMKTQDIDFSQDPDKLFIPSNYLVSPFNSTAVFMNGEYFLTTQQEKIKTEIFDEVKKGKIFFTLYANAGTGKTLLMYDIARELIGNGDVIQIIHCGILNDGHYTLLNKYGWDIVSVKDVCTFTEGEKNRIQNKKMIFVDESQRINQFQIEALTNAAKELKISVLFSYDTKQYLKDGESLDIKEYLESHFEANCCEHKRLTNKIRTNKEMSSFITNLIDIGKSRDNLDYSCVSIEYFEDMLDLSKYVEHLKDNGWKFIKFTTSLKDPLSDPYHYLEQYAEVNAHKVIGQEFSKVAFIMDSHFAYNETGKLVAKSNYYSATGMLYQIVTRVVDELKIIVIDNPSLYYNLLRIKKMDSRSKSLITKIEANLKNEVYDVKTKSLLTQCLQILKEEF